MGMTITEKILADHSDHDVVKAGDLIEARIDLALANDITAPLSIETFERSGTERVFDPERIALIPDHFAPNKDIHSAIQCQRMREFAHSHNLALYFEIGRMGIEHALLPEQGVVLPGDVVVGADSHTCTYGALGAFSTGVGSTDLAAAWITGRVWFRVPSTIKFIYTGSLQPWVSGKDLILYTIGQIGVDGARYCAMEFSGETIHMLTMDDRLTMANMAIEAGSKNGIFIPDKTTEEYVESRARRSYTFYESDRDAEYENIYEFDVSKLEPQVAMPHSPENARPISEIPEISIDQVVIGSCTNGRINDLRTAATIMKGEKVSPGIRCIVIPATQAIYRQALKEGLIETFIDAEAIVSTPTCGPCLGGHMGILAPGEKAVATTNRNFVGRMGHPSSEVYLSSPAIAAASAVLGKIGSPAEIKKN